MVRPHNTRPAPTGADSGPLTADPAAIRLIHTILLFSDQISIMLLSGQEIRNRQDDGLRIEPFSDDRLNPNSYNLALHHELLIYEEVVLDAASPNRYRRIEIPEEGLTLQPNQLYLGRTVEYTETRGYVPMIQGRSSLGTLGSIHQPRWQRRRRRLLRDVDPGDVLRAAGPNLSRHADLPDLLLAAGRSV